jgi:methylated-DNA-[protein]-cysteine S-methyltransferase
MKIYKTYYQSEIGLIEIAGDEKELRSVDFVETSEAPSSEVPTHLQECFRQIDEYFQGRRKEFSLNLRLEGTDFQKKVWQELIRIPFGKTASYGEIAKAIGNEKAVRAVGQANHNNPISIIVPCHRVIGRNGGLVGYGGGLWRKNGSSTTREGPRAHCVLKIPLTTWDGLGEEERRMGKSHPLLDPPPSRGRR